MAARMRGARAISARPSAAMVPNHTSVMGPNALPTFDVPKRCTMNSRSRIATVTATTDFSIAGATTLSPSTAPSTEMAGVMMPSP